MWDYSTKVSVFFNAHIRNSVLSEKIMLCDKIYMEVLDKCKPQMTDAQIHQTIAELVKDHIKNEQFDRDIGDMLK